MKVNVYDFDKTIYKNDSCVDLIKYTFRKHPFLIISSILKALPYGVLYLFNKKCLKKLKEQIVSFTLKIKDFDKYIDKYWNEKQVLIKAWYLDQKEENDVIVSANFEFLIKPICKKLGIKHYIATSFDIETGKIIGMQCRCENKIQMFKEKYPDFKINKTYSDSKNDIPLLEVGNPGYVVKDNKLIKYYKGYFK